MSKEKDKKDNNKHQGIIPVNIVDEMKESYLDYSMSVIVSRALPDVRDGLKPVHRRILFSMHELGLNFGGKFRKSATVVGDVLGKYHPHGDSACYDALARMAQDFSMRYRLVAGQGNFGSIDGDSPAAMRYCLTGDTLVPTDRGLERIDKISSGEKIDRKVLSLGRRINKASKWFASGIHPTIKVVTERGLSIQGSNNHPLLTRKKCLEGFRFTWKLLEDITEGDEVVIDKSPDLLWPQKEVSIMKYYPTGDEKVTLPKTLNSNLAFILGALMAGNGTKNNMLEFSSSNEEKVEKFKTAWKDVFVNLPFDCFKNKAGWTLRSKSSYLSAFLENVDLYGKGIPQIILSAPKDIMTSFLQSFWEEDTTRIVLSNKRLIKELQIILLRFGLVTNLSFDRNNKTYGLCLENMSDYISPQEQTGFTSSSPKNSYKYGQLFPNSLVATKEFKQQITTIVEKKINVDSLLSTNYLFDTVNTVKKMPAEKVYSLKVDSSCHSFVSNGFISHNTEAKMAKLSSELLKDIEKETVNFRPNYDGSRKEPIVLPSTVPNLLLNGTLGIAVGMATKIPPHNLSEVMGALIYLADNKEATNEDLLEYVKGPDFPTGGVIFNHKDIRHAYATGRGGVLLRGEAEIIESKPGSFQIIISSIPYQVNKAELIIKIADLVRDKKLEGIRDIRDESTRDVRIVVELKSGGQPQTILNSLYKHTELETTFHFNTLALVDGVPRLLNLKGLLEEFIKHRQEVIVRRTKYDLRQAEDREHILLGLKKALDHIDAIIKTIKKSADAKVAHKELMKQFKFSDRQATAILEMRLQKLSGLERQKIEEELKEKQRLIKEYKAILASVKKVINIMKDEFVAIREKYGDDRKTKVIKSAIKEINPEDLIPEKEDVLVITSGGYIKRTDPKEYRSQKRGGRGVMDLNVREEDFVSIFLTANTHDDLLFFSNRGKVYQTKMYDIPDSRRASRGKSIMNFLPLEAEESITSVKPRTKEEKSEESFIVMITKKGVAKKVEAKNFKDVRRSGLLAIKLAADDSLFSVLKVKEGDNIILATREGQAICFNQKDLRSMGRPAAGVRALRLKKNDEVIGASAYSSETEGRFLVLTEKGYGKMTELAEYKAQKRGGSGVKTAKVTDKTGKLVIARIVTDEEEVIAISRQGQVIRIKLSELPVLGRQTQGVRMMRMKSGDMVATFTCL